MGESETGNCVHRHALLKLRKALEGWPGVALLPCAITAGGLFDSMRFRSFPMVVLRMDGIEVASRICSGMSVKEFEDLLRHCIGRRSQRAS